VQIATIPIDEVREYQRNPRINAPTI